MHALAAALIVFFNVVFCLPYALPVTAELMNYNCVILPGILFTTTAWWCAAARTRYRGPRAPWDNENADIVDNETDI